MIFSSEDVKVFPASLSVMIMPWFLNKTLKKLLWTMMQLSAQPLTLFSFLHVPLSIRLSCLLSFCSFSKPLPPATFIPQSCHFCVSSISFISFASFMSFVYLSLCLFLFPLQSNCQVHTPLCILFFIPHLLLPSGFLHRFFPAYLSFIHSLFLAFLLLWSISVLMRWCSSLQVLISAH